MQATPDTPATDDELDGFYGSIALNHSGLDAQDAINAIRRIEQLEVEHVRNILAALGAKMAESGFHDVDIEMIDESIGIICGDA